jgi:hypothetical protein
MDPEEHTGVYTRSAHAVASSVGDRVVLYHRTSKTAIVLNPTGSWLWEQLSQPRTPGQLAEKLLERFPTVQPDEAAGDVARFLGELTQHAMAAPRE